MDAASLARLLGPEGRALIAELPPYAAKESLRVAARLRERGVDAGLVAAALTQSRLRARAEAKFGAHARRMLFTEAGLEQATRLEVATAHARRYAAAGPGRVADLGCGLGGDALALASAGLAVLAVEADALTAALATENLRPFPAVEVRHGDALAVDLTGVTALYADPARRDAGGRRILDPARYAPPLDAVLELRRSVPALGVKVAPGLPYSALPPDAHAQWVSVAGEVVEAGLWFGALAPEGPGRSALLLAGDGARVLTEPTAPRAPARRAEVRPLGPVLYEPDGAVIRAGLVARLAEDLGAGVVSEDIAYLSGPGPTPTPFATAYRVLDAFPFGVKRLRTYLRERGVGALTIKKRGTAVTPETLRHQLGLRGPASATIVLTRLAGRHSVLLVEPLPDTPDLSR